MAFQREHNKVSKRRVFASAGKEEDAARDKTKQAHSWRLVALIAALALALACAVAVGCAAGCALDAGSGANSGMGANASAAATGQNASASNVSSEESEGTQAEAMAKLLENEDAYEPGCVIAILAEGATAEALQNALSADERLQGVAIEDVGSDHVKLSLPAELPIDQAMALLQESELVEAAQPNFVYTTMEDASSTDAAVSSGLTTTSAATTTTASTAIATAGTATPAAATSDLSAALVPDGFFDTQATRNQWALPAVKAPEAWETVTASITEAARANPTTVAIMDQGFMLNHEDFDPHLLAATYDVAGDQEGAAPDTNVSGTNGHGTHVLGIIAATSTNANGVSGVQANDIGVNGITNNWCKVLPIKVAYNNGYGMSTDTVSKAYDYLLSGAAQTHNVKVVNISLGMNQVADFSGIDLLVKRRITAAREQGITTVVAASNTDSTFVTAPFYALPGDYPNVITVMNVRAAANSDGVELDTSSNFNMPGQTAKNICAPGTSIISLGTNPTSYVIKTGTSMASPCMAGIVGLLYTVKPDITPTQVENVLYSTAKDLTQTAGSKVGWDEKTGYGLVNAAAAMQKAAENSGVDTPPSPATPTIPVEPSTPSNPSTQPSTPAAPQTTPMYRLYNKWSNEHFYTANRSEYLGLIKKGWNDEKIAWYAPVDGVAVYRLYNEWSGDHHYTTSGREYDRCVENGWRGEGVAFYSDGDKPVYRLFNPYEKAFFHHYTTSASEVRQCVRAGWRDEGIGWYGY